MIRGPLRNQLGDGEPLPGTAPWETKPPSRPGLRDAQFSLQVGHFVSTRWNQSMGQHPSALAISLSDQ